MCGRAGNSPAAVPKATTPTAVLTVFVYASRSEHRFDA